MAVADPLVPTAAYNTIRAYAVYLKKGGKGNLADYLKKKITGSDCDDCGGDDSCSDDKCSCCAPGLVAVFDDKGNNLGCLTPADAELYTLNTLECNDGYAKLFNNTTGQFIGCVSEGAFAALYTTLNP